MEARVRPLCPGEGARLRSFRLRALRDSPHAFFWPREAEERFPPEYWEAWTTEGRAMFVAEEDGRWLGMAGCTLRQDGSRVLEGTGMWVEPHARGRRLGELLIAAIMTWGRQYDAVRMEFAVTETNVTAIALYRRLGFEPTGRRRTLASDPSQVGIFMSAPL